MRIDSQTKIATLLKHHPDALEAIITLSPDFKKLRNPILRKLMAGRTSIAMASKIGACQPEDFFKVLKPLGFEADIQTNETDTEQTSKPMPDYLRLLSPDKIDVFDVREMLAQGNDPLRDIQNKINKLPIGKALNIINTFEPVPLIKLLEKQGFESYVNQQASDYFETYFYKTGAERQTDLEIEVKDSQDWEEVFLRYEGRLRKIDVRHLNMPLPMMTILENLETIQLSEALYVYHKRIPVFLLTELKDRKFEYRIRERQEGEVDMLIFRNE